MIKFFRHIRKNLLMENKTGKYFKYAIGEIILVVIGILIALQVNNWNETRKLINDQNTYLGNLRKELLQNDVRLKLRLKQYKDLDNRHIELAGLMNTNPRPITKSKLDTLVHAMIYMPVYNPIKTFANSDKLETINNEELKKLIALWHFELESYNYDTTIIYDLYYNAIYPFLQENYQLLTLQSKALGTAPSTFPVNHANILSSPIFENQVAMKSINHRNAYEQLLTLEQLQEDILTQINKSND